MIIASGSGKRFECMEVYLAHIRKFLRNKFAYHENEKRVDLRREIVMLFQDRHLIRTVLKKFMFPLTCF